MEQNKKLAIGPIDLKVDRALLIESVNLNDFKWQIEKTVEELIEAADALNHYKRNDAAPEQVCLELADVTIQLAIMVELFGSANIQHFIYNKQKAISNRNKRLRRKLNVGFISGSKD